MMRVTCLLLCTALVQLFMGSWAQQEMNYEAPVFGCFKQFRGDGTWYLGYDNSNLRCQEKCRSSGYPLASTTSCTYCSCGHKFPTEAKRNNTDCLFSCEPQCKLHLRPLQASCGGSNTYIISGTGNTDMNKEILRNMIQGWGEKTDLRKEFIRRAAQSRLTPPVGYPLMMRGMERRECLGYRPNRELVSHVCETGYVDQFWKIEHLYGYYSPFYRIRNNARDRPHCLEVGPGDPKDASVKAATCSTNSKQQWTFRYFSGENWYVKYGDYKLFMRYHSNPFLGVYNGGHHKDQEWKFEQHSGTTTWLEDPEISVTVKQDTGVYKKCTGRVKDKSPSLGTYTCRDTSSTEKLVTIEAVEAVIVDATPLTPTPPELLGRMICDNADSSVPLLCRRSISVSYSVTSGYSATTTINVAATVSASMEVVVNAGVPVLNAKTTSSLSSVLHSEGAFTSTEHHTETETITHTYEAEVTVEPGKLVTINVFRERQDVTFAWKTLFIPSGPFELLFTNSYKDGNAVSKLLTEDKLLAFGMYTYPDVDVIRAKTTEGVNVVLQKLDN